MFIRRRNLFPPIEVSGLSILFVKIELLGLYFISSFLANELFVPNADDEAVFLVVGVVLLTIKAFFLIYPAP